LGYPKVPTVLVYQLVNAQYQPHTFTGSEPIISPTFPELKLSVEQIITASQIRKI